MAPTTLTRAPDWRALRDGFSWPRLERFNIARAICEDWAKSDPERVALIHPQADGKTKNYSYGQLSRLSDKLACVFREVGLRAGGRVGILLGQTPETLLTHIATYKSGAIAVPLFTLFGADGLHYRLQDSGAMIVVTDAANLDKIHEIRADLPDLIEVFCIDGDTDTRDFWSAMVAARTGFDIVETKPDTPALLVYTSGTTGPPKGALHGHRVLIGHLPGVESHHDFFPQKGDCAWTPADWAWMGGLADILLPSLMLGVPVVAYRAAKFDADDTYRLIKEHKIKNVFFPPTALKFLRQSPLPGPLGLRSVASGGEALGADFLAWGQEAFGVTINEFYGSTECNLVLGNCAEIMEPRPGSTGRAVPGKEVTIIDKNGETVAPGVTGEIAVKRGDPAMFLEYWNNPEKTKTKFSGDWMRMGDEAYMDEDGFFFFSARTDDVINSAGYRIGPSEIEGCLMAHDDVALAGVVGVPDETKGEVIKAFVVLSEGATLDEAALRSHVAERLSPHMTPRSIEAIEALPLTATGKIMRRELKLRG